MMKNNLDKHKKPHKSIKVNNLARYTNCRTVKTYNSCGSGGGEAQRIRKTWYCY